MRVLELVSELKDYLWMIFLFGGIVAWISARGLFASPEKLAAMLGQIGTKSPRVARVVCAIGIVMGTGAFVGGLVMTGRGVIDFIATRSTRSEGAGVRESLVSYNRAVERDKAGDPDAAIGAYREAIRLNPDLAEAHANLGRIWLAREKGDEAAACYREAIRLHPEWSFAHANLGLALVGRGKLDEALAACREAIRLDPSLADAHANLGSILNKQGRSDEAAASYREAIRIDPDFAEAHNDLGSVLLAGGKDDEAAACFREAIRVRPDFAPARENLALTSNAPRPAPSGASRPPDRSQASLPKTVEELKAAIVAATLPKTSPAELAGDKVDGLTLGKRREIFSAIWRANRAASDEADRKFPFEGYPKDPVEARQYMPRRNAAYDALKATGWAALIKRFEIDQARAEAIEKEGEAKNWPVD